MKVDGGRQCDNIRYEAEVGPSIAAHEPVKMKVDTNPVLVHTSAWESRP